MPEDLVSDGVDVVLGVEVVQLVRQELPDVEEGQRSDPEGVLVDPLRHDLGHLPVLVPVHEDATVDGQSGQLLVFLA